MRGISTAVVSKSVMRGAQIANDSALKFVSKGPPCSEEPDAGKPHVRVWAGGAG
jgi:hypothetical protein